jgi:DHA1 family inner membrane transport protein
MSEPMCDEAFSSAVDPRRARVSAAEVALAVGGFGIGTGEFAIMGLLPQVAEDVSVSVPQAGAVISAYALGTHTRITLSCPIFGIFHGFY